MRHERDVGDGGRVLVKRDEAESGGGRPEFHFWVAAAGGDDGPAWSNTGGEGRVDVGKNNKQECRAGWLVGMGDRI